MKPGNIMLSADGTVRLLDFGLAKGTDATISGREDTAGTVAYMSPEQARGDTVDHRTDLWSLGVVLHEMLAGGRPFRGKNDHAIVHAILHEQPVPLPPALLDASPSLSRIVSRLLRKTPDQRYQSADELLGALTRFAPDGISNWVQSHRRGVAVSIVGSHRRSSAAPLADRPPCRHAHVRSRSRCSA